jgi:sulfane dehydrogenase subunit SoxC
VYLGHPDYAPDAPVTQVQVRALITEPADGDVATAGDAGVIHVRGVAWSGFGRVVSVDVSDDEGVTWSPAELSPPASPYAAVQWSYGWRPAHGPGEHVIMARATDSSGRVQPLDPVWNELGYANNGVQRVGLRSG